MARGSATVASGRAQVVPAGRSGIRTRGAGFRREQDRDHRRCQGGAVQRSFGGVHRGLPVSAVDEAPSINPKFMDGCFGCIGTQDSVGPVDVHWSSPTLQASHSGRERPDHVLRCDGHEALVAGARTHGVGAVRVPGIGISRAAGAELPSGGDAAAGCASRHEKRPGLLRARQVAGECRTPA